LIGLIGFGSWGTALSVACSHNKKDILVWVRSKKQKFFFKKFFFNLKYTKNLYLKNNVTVTLNVDKLLKKSHTIILATPSFVLKYIFSRIIKKIKEYHKIVISCKGFSKGVLLHSVILSKLKNNKIYNNFIT